MNTENWIVIAETQDVLDKCLAVRRAVFTVERGVSEQIEVDGFDRLGDVCDHILIESEGMDVGALRCMHMDDGAIRLQRFCVLQDYRREGHGRMALGLLEEHYRRKGVPKIVLDSKFEAIGFYEKCGYEKVSDIFEEAGIPHVKMEKYL